MTKLPLVSLNLSDALNLTLTSQSAIIQVYSPSYSLVVSSSGSIDNIHFRFICQTMCIYFECVLLYKVVVSVEMQDRYTQESASAH